MKKNFIIVVIMIVILAIGFPVLDENYLYFVKMWFTLLCTGIIFLPISTIIFKKSENIGWIFSKVLGIIIPATIIWYLSYMKILKYTELNCFILIAILTLITICVFVKKKQYKNIDIKKINSILITEIIFITVFIAWTWVRSHMVEITPVTEQFMNYGFINKLMNTEYLPAEDIWFSGHYINYYYYGQYIISFIGKISFFNVNELYNIMMALMSTFTFIMPFTIAFTLGKRIINKNEKNKIVPYILAILTGLSICIGGTMHYPIYCYTNIGEESYEYFDAVRYLSDDTEKVAHEMPSYSNIIGDLHAHYVNTMFSFITLAVLLEIILR